MGMGCQSVRPLPLVITSEDNDENWAEQHTPSQPVFAQTRTLRWPGLRGLESVKGVVCFELYRRTWSGGSIMAGDPLILSVTDSALCPSQRVSMQTT